MIESVDDYVELVRAGREGLVERYRWVEAEESVWMQILDALPDEWSEVSLNKTLPDSVLRRLVREGDERVRKIVAMKHKCLQDLLILLSEDPCSSVQFSVLNNKNVSRSTLLRMCDSDDDWIRERARLKLKELESNR